jgi:hypothetical protein
MKISIGWIAIFLLISLSTLVVVLPLRGSFAAVKQSVLEEGFESPQTNDLDIQTCPPNTNRFVDRETGYTLCCSQELQNGVCPVKAVCSITKNPQGYPSCTTYMQAYLEQKGAGRCFSAMPNYYENPTTGVRGCCAGSRTKDGMGPLNPAAGFSCRIYSTVAEEQQRGDSCTNVKASPRYWDLPKFQSMFESAGCTRKLTAGDVNWWRTQSAATVQNDMNAYASLTRGCKGNTTQHNFCVPGSCAPRR